MKLSAGEIIYRMLRPFQKDFLISGNILNAWFVTAFIMNSLHIHIPFLITLVAGDIVSSEATSGTIRFLLIRPPFPEQDHYGQIPDSTLLYRRTCHFLCLGVRFPRAPSFLAVVT